MNCNASSKQDNLNKTTVQVDISINSLRENHVTQSARTNDVIPFMWENEEHMTTKTSLLVNGTTQLNGTPRSSQDSQKYLDTTLESGYLTAMGSGPHSNTSESDEGSQYQLPAEGSQYQLPAESSQYQLPAEGSQYQLPVEGSQYQLPAEGSQYQLPVEGSQYRLPKLSKYQLLADSDQKHKLATSGSFQWQCSEQSLESKLFASSLNPSELGKSKTTDVRPVSGGATIFDCDMDCFLVMEPQSHNIS